MIYPLIVKGARAVVVFMGVIGLVVILCNMLPILDAIDYAQNYVAGNVAQGYMTQREGSQILQREEARLRPYLLQLLGVAGATVALWKIVALGPTKPPP